jgi:large subunit ribosomal protein L24
MNRPKFHVKKGDNVQVTTGNHRGAQGKILAVLPKKSQVLIEGVRLIKKHTRKSQDHPQGAIIEREGPIHVSNVKIVEAAPEAKPKKKKVAKSAKK